MPPRTYNYDNDLQPIVNGDVPVPNFEPMEPGKLLNAIAAGGHSMRPAWGYASINGRRTWAQFFLTGIGMGSPPSTYGGGGYIIAYANPEPIAGTFAICRHEMLSRRDADHRRGWHPGHCAKCGINMTVDSGD